MVLALEDAGDQLAALGQAEELRRWAGGRRVALEALDGTRAQGQHAVLRLAAQHLLPGPGDHIELRPGQVPWAEDGGGGGRRREAAPVRGRSTPRPAPRTPEVVPFQVKTMSRSGSWRRDRAAARNRLQNRRRSSSLSCIRGIGEPAEPKLSKATTSTPLAPSMVTIAVSKAPVSDAGTMPRR